MLTRPVQTDHNGVSLWLGRCVSAGRTELICAFDGVEPLVEEQPAASNSCPLPWWRDFRLGLRDAAGREFPSERFHGGGTGARRSFTATFPPLEGTIRAAELRIDGPFGAWHLPFELVPLDGVPARQLDVTSTEAHVTLAATAFARGDDYAAVRVVASAEPPLRRIDEVGRGGPLGDRHDPVLQVGEEGTGQRVRRRLDARRSASGALEQVLLFAAIPREPVDVVLACDRVLVEEDVAPCVIHYPDAVGEYAFGRFRLRVVSARPNVASRFGRAVGLDIDIAGTDGRWLSRESVEVDGVHALVGVGRSAVSPSLHLDVLHPGYEPFAIALTHPIVETDGDWELRFRA